MQDFVQLFTSYNIPGAFLVNIEITLWSVLFSTIIGVILVTMRICPVASLRMVATAYVELFKKHASYNHHGFHGVRRVRSA